MFLVLLDLFALVIVKCFGRWVLILNVNGLDFGSDLGFFAVSRCCFVYGFYFSG